MSKTGPLSLSTLEILSDLIIYDKYARYLSDKQRRETWKEIVDRNKEMHIKHFLDYNITKEIEETYSFVYDKLVLPSMRGLQFGGKAIEVAPNRALNCAALAINHWEAFSEIMFLLLGGSGIGFSVQKHHVEQLPEIRMPLQKSRRFLIEDSIEGWAEAVRTLIRTYFFGLSQPRFDFSIIREKGTPLKTSGGKAPGPQPLKDCLHNLTKIFESKKPGDKLKPIEVYDMVNHIADAVLAGGIRRAALLALFSLDDEEMLNAKYGEWWETNPQRGRSNNSVALIRHKIRKKDFMKLWERISLSDSGEPAFVLSNDREWLINPCGEISLRSNSFCNLTTINVNDITNQKDLNDRVKAAAFIGTLQAAYTDFHYIRDIWQRNCEKEALLGISMTGIASGNILQFDLEEAVQIAIQENQRVAKLINIKPAARLTCIKPSGTSSLVLKCSSGIHAWYAPYYIRRIRMLKTEAIYKYLKKKLPQLVEDDYFKPNTEAIFSIPIKAPENAICSNENVLDLLERIKHFNLHWIKPGHIDGENTNNVSATVYIEPNEWEQVGEWMWANRQNYNGLTVLPRNTKAYKQPPFEEITEEKYLELIKFAKKIDLTEIIEEEDNTDVKQEPACAGNACEIS